ncbi:hypothetical protein C0Q70_18554 [Pomacea canaliculata]|uniref:Cyclic nucleotide-binding domain-containing protein n=1 Tax=Pomacea canaliculata TaxID=400727 RepID=A0A2T7NGV3_POMCA|nr:hypothetical protein C0Q70_18554 [Pomacea canaliculata]
MIVSQEKRKKYQWNFKNTNYPRNKLPAITNAPTVDYQALEWLNSIHGLSSSIDKLMVHSDSEQATGRPTSEAERKTVRKKLTTEEFTHNIKDYLPLFHKEHKSQDPAAVRADNIKTLRQILRKLVWQHRSSHGVTREGNPLTEPHIFTALNTTDSDLRSPTPVLESSDTVLEPGDCFGTVLKLKDKAPSTRLLSVKTMENNCEFLKISASDYSKVNEQIQLREHTEKLNLLLSCSQYRMWPRQPLIQVATHIEWLTYPPNTVIVSEGYKAPFIGFIKTGECHVLRQVDVLQTLRNGHKEKRTKQVVMGKLGPSDSFAELSLLQDEPVTCSIVTATDVEMGVIKPGHLHELDQVTVQLFKHSSTHTFGELTKEDIQNEYVHQEQKRAWNEFKHSVIVDVINANGIRPGYGNGPSDRHASHGNG